MFAPIAVDNINFTQRATISTLDFLAESFEAWDAYSNIPTASTYTTSSTTTNLSWIGRWGISGDGRLLGIDETGTTAVILNTDTNTTSSITVSGAGTIRNVLWDSITNNWVVCGSSNFVKVNCDTLSTTSIAVPANYTANQYASVVAYNGKVYACPLANINVSSAPIIVDLVANTAVTSSVKFGNTSGYWGAVLNSIGTIYFFTENGATNASILEYDPQTDTGTKFGTLTSTPGYLVTNLPDGRVYAAQYNAGTSIYLIDPKTKVISTISKGGVSSGQNGICVGQNGHVYAIRSAQTGNNGIYGFNPKTNVMYQTQYLVQAPSSGDRGFQDLFSLADGRLVALPGQNNSGRITYYTYLAYPNNGTISNIGAANPIVQGGKGN